MDIIDITGKDIQRAATRVGAGRDAARADAKKDVVGKETDSVSVSSRAKLLHQLRKSYEKLDKPAPEKNIEELKDRIKQGLHKLTAEEIVVEILRGTIFETS
ncbi:MAG: flagellar biosynthesis anti-sigma factor FlgM [bacterium]